MVEVDEGAEEVVVGDAVLVAGGVTIVVIGTVVVVACVVDTATAAGEGTGEGAGAVKLTELEKLCSTPPSTPSELAVTTTRVTAAITNAARSAFTASPLHD